MLVAGQRVLHSLSVAVDLSVTRPLIDETSVPTCRADAVPDPNRKLTPEDRLAAYSLACAYYITLTSQPDLWLHVSTASPDNVRRWIQSHSDLDLLAGFVVSLLGQENTVVSILDSWINVGVEQLVQLIAQGEFTLRVDNDNIYLFPEKHYAYAIMQSFLVKLPTSETCFFFAELVRRKHLFTSITTSRDRKILMMSGFCYDPELRAMINRVQLVAAVIQRFLQPQNTKKHKITLNAALTNVKNAWTTAPSSFKLPLTDREQAAFKDFATIMSQRIVQISRIAPYTHGYDVQEASVDLLKLPTEGAPAAAAATASTTVQAAAATSSVGHPMEEAEESEDPFAEQFPAPNDDDDEDPFK